MEIPIINEIVIIFALSIAVLLACHRLRVPSVVGFLLTGVICGPHGFGLVSNIIDVQQLAMVGIVLLLFTVGMEFSFKNIIKYKYFFFVGGGLQLLFTISACVIGGRFLLHQTWGEAVFLGFLVSLSSTAIVLRALEEKGEKASPHGRLILGVLIFQDVLAIPMMLMVPILAGTGEELSREHLYTLGKGFCLLVIMAMLAYRAVPKLLYYVTRTRNKELFLLSVLTICFSVAWITSSVGLSLSLGAFLAGLVISESEYSDEAAGHVLPFQAIFTSFFFVSMGMLLDVGFVLREPLLIFALTLLVLSLKCVMAALAALILGVPLRSAILAAVSLCQIGEFSFVIAQTGISVGLTSEFSYQLFLAVSLLTMALTPALISLVHEYSGWIFRLPLPQKIKTGLRYVTPNSNEHKLENHLIIVGFGMRGRHLARMAKEKQIPYLILEMNPDTVKMEKKNGEPIRYGDPSHPSVLKHAGIQHAHLMVVVINDDQACIKIIKTAKELNPEVHLIGRVRYFQESRSIFNAGADEVITDELGSSLEILTRVMQKCGVDAEEIGRCVGTLRSESDQEAVKWSAESAHMRPVPT